MKEFVFLFTILLAVAGFAAAQESETPMQRMMKGEDGGTQGGIKKRYARGEINRQEFEAMKKEVQ